MAAITRSGDAAAEDRQPAGPESNTIAELAALVAVPQFEPIARARLDPAIWDYVAGGSGDEHTLHRNLQAWQHVELCPRSLVDVSRLDTSLEFLGMTLSHPIVVAPTARHAAYHPEGETATIAGAARAEALYVQSSLGSTALLDVGTAAEASNARWLFQLYVQRDRGFTQELVAEAVAAGAKALVLTIDTPCLGARDRDQRNQFGAIDGFSYPILANAPMVNEPVPAHRRVYNPLLAPDVTWDDLDWLIDISPIPVITKGHLRPDEAVRAAVAGVAAVIVSNHGGRNLDTVPATATALPRIVDAIGGAVPVLVDGGIRRGTDIAKALCSGATAVLVGRPAIWGLAVGGAAGVTHVLEILRTELEMAMALLGAPTIADLGPGLLNG